MRPVGQDIESGVPGASETGGTGYREWCAKSK